MSLPSFTEAALGIARKFVGDNDVSHDMAHVRRVVKNALKILEQSDQRIKSEIEEPILIAIAALHDCLDKKYVTEAEMPTKLAELKQDMRERLNLNDEQIAFILKTVDMISYTTEKAGGEAATSQCPYLAIARDADRLEAIGAIGAARCFAFSASRGRPLVTETYEAEERIRLDPSAGNKNESAIVHFYDKLINLLPRFKTEPGKAMAQNRHQFLLLFLDQIRSEVY
jgi:uncharacterized protein